MKNRNIYSYILLFNLTSVFGYLMETLGMSFNAGELIDRGFLNVPLLPIYGIGSVMLAWLLEDKRYPFIKNFVIVFFVASIFEYTSSAVLEKLFHQRWWDYYGNKYNINGRVAIWSSLGFALGGAVVVHFISPLTHYISEKARINSLRIFTWPLFLITIGDFVYVVITKLFITS